MFRKRNLPDYLSRIFSYVISHACCACWITDYSLILRQCQQIELAECPDLRIKQANTPDYLLAEGANLTKDRIELKLESYLGDIVNDPDYQVLAERIENTSDKWKIRVGSEGDV